MNKKIILRLGFAGIMFSSVIFFYGCGKNNTRVPEPAVITGLDMRYCLCCGGWFIEIGDSTYRFYTLPEQSDIDLRNEEFPLSVNVLWEKHDPPCLGDEIDILAISRR